MAPLMARSCGAAWLPAPALSLGAGVLVMRRQRRAHEQSKANVMTSFQVAKRAAHGIPGMLSDFSIAVMDTMLSYQEDHGIAGHLVEMGVYKGRSAAVLGSHAKPDERLVLVDTVAYIERAKLEAICPQLEFVLCSSDQFPSTYRGYRQIKGACRCIHVDASHQYQPTFRELQLSEELLCDRGMIILDDFANLNYSQILAAIYKYLYTTSTQLCVFLVTKEKAYLCKKRDFQFFGRFVLEQIIAEMTKRETPETCIARTDVDPEYRAFHLRGRSPGENGPYYGEHIYGYCYQQA
jgi:hypothetical protein